MSPFGRTRPEPPRCHDRPVPTPALPTFRATWSTQARRYIATALEYPHLSHAADTPADALRGIQELVAALTGDLRPDRQPPPQP